MLGSLWVFSHKGLVLVPIPFLVGTDPLDPISSLLD